MAISLFYIPGTSDVYLYSGEKEYRRFINFYCVTEKVWGMLEKGDIERREDGWKIKTPQEVEVRFNKNDCENILPDTVTLPIFSSLLKKLKEEDINITNIYFFATAQEPLHSKDTLFAAKILEKFAKERLKRVEVKIEKITKNPSSYDEMSKFFEEFVKSSYKELKLNAENYVSVTTGTPAQVVSLALSIMQFPVQYLYIKENKEVVHCTSFNSLNKKIYAGQICQLIDGFRYSSALEIVENSPFRGNSEILNTLRAMEKRMLFDFEGALDDARNIRDERLHFLSEELSELARKNAVYLLLELFYRIENRFKRKDYLEAVASLFSLIEFGLHYIFFLLAKHEGKIPGYFVVEKVKSEFNDYVENNPDLKNYLKKGETNYKNASQVAFRKAIGFILNKSENSEALSKIKNSVESFLKLEEEFGKEKDTDYGKISLRELRNSGPYAHSTKGINEALLGRLLSPFTVEGFVEEMVRKPIEDICGKKTDNPFLKVNEILKEILAKEVE